MTRRVRGKAFSVLVWVGMVYIAGALACGTASWAQDGFEPDNTPAQATAVAPGLQTGHSIVPASDIDWFTFTLPADEVVTLLTQGASGNTLLRLYTSELVFLDEDDDSGSGAFSQLVLRLPAGTYYASVVESGQDAEIASYSIGLTSGSRASDAYEPDDIWMTATPIAPGETQDHILSDNRAISDVVDWYVLTLAEDANVELSALDLDPEFNGGGQAFSSQAPPFQLYTSALALLAEAGQGFREDGVARARLRVFLEAGVYYARAAKGDFALTGSFNRSYAFSFATPARISGAYEPDNSAAEAAPIEVGETQLGRAINPYGDEDWVTFTLPATTPILLHGRDAILEDLESPGLGLEVYTSDLTPIASGNPALIDLQPGTYFGRFRVPGGANLIRRYSVQLLDRDGGDDYEPDDDIESANYVPLGGPPQVHNFTSGTDQDWFSFIGVGGTVVIIEVTPLSPGVILKIELFLFSPPKRGGSKIEEDDLTPIPLDENNSAVIPEDGTYYVRVTPDEGSTDGPDSYYSVGMKSVSGDVGGASILPGSVVGVVRTDHGDPLEGARVTIQQAPGLFAYSDGQGGYGFTISPSGSYTLFAEKDGFQSGQGFTDIPNGQIVQLDFSLLDLDQPELLVTPVSRSVSSGAGSTSFSIANVGSGSLHWQAEVLSGGEWLSFTSPSSGVGGSAISLSYGANASGASRSATVRITGTDGGGSPAVGSPAEVTVTQTGSPAAVLELSENQLTFGPAAGSQIVHVRNAGGGVFAWSAAVISGAAFLSIETAGTTGDGVIVINAAANTGASRGGTIRVTAPGAQGSPADITVTQGAASTPVLSVTPALFQFGAGASQGLAAVSNAGGGALDWSVAVVTGSEWISAGASKVLGPGQIAISAAQNATGAVRQGTVRVSAAGAIGSPVDITVEQAPVNLPVMAVSPALFDVSADSGIRQALVSNEGGGVLNWTASAIAGAEWLSVVNAKISDAGTVTLSFTQNLAAAARVGVVRVVAVEALNPEVDIVVRQAAAESPVLEVSPDSLTVPAGAGERALAVTNGGGGALDWSATVSAGTSWLGISAAKVLGDGGIAVSFSENTTGATRVGVVRIEAPGALNPLAEVPVTQAAASTPVLRVTPGEIFVGPDGSVETLTIANDGGGTLNWTAEVTAGGNWQVVSNGSGTGPGSATVTVLSNETNFYRQGIVRVTAAGAAGSPVDVPVTQAPYSTIALPVLNVSPVDVTAEAAAGSKQVSVSNAGSGVMTWNAIVIAGDSWLTAMESKGTNGGTVSLNYTANATGNSRVGIVRIDAGDVLGSPVDVTVLQPSSVTPVLSVSPTLLDVGFAAGSSGVAITNAGTGVLDWNAQVISGSDWLSASAAKVVGDGALTITYAKNETSSSRSGVVRVTAVTASNSPVDITVNQAGSPPPALGVSPQSLAFGAAGGVGVLSIANTGGGSLIWSATVMSGSSFISVDASAGTGDGAVAVTVSANPTASARAGTIRISAPGASNSPVDVSVSQSGAQQEPQPVLAVSRMGVSFSASGGQEQVLVTNAGDGVLEWSAQVTGGGSWLSVAAAKVTGAGTLTLTAAQNTTGSARSGSVRVTAPGALGSPVDIEVVQGAAGAPRLTVSPTALNVSAASGSAQALVSNTGEGTLEWLASVIIGDSWLSISTAKRTGDGAIQVFFAQNESSNERIGVIRVSSSNAVNSFEDIVVRQAGAPAPVLLVNPSALNVGSQAGAAALTVTNGGGGTLEWSVSVISGESWLTATVAKVTGDGGVIVSFAANPADAIRTGIIRVSAPGASNPAVDVTVTQAAGESPVLFVTPGSLTFGAGGGAQQVNVSNAGGGAMEWTVSVTSGAAWLTASASKILGNGTVAVSAAPNGTGEPRAGIVRISAPGALGSPVDIGVQQAGIAGQPVLTLSRTQFVSGRAAGQRVIDVINAGGGFLEWSASVVAGGEWLSVEAAKDGSGALTVVYLENTGSVSRQGTIEVSSSNGGGPILLKASQTATVVPGDIDGNQVVNATDVQNTILAALGLGGVAATDINGDGVVNSVDVQLVILAALDIPL